MLLDCDQQSEIEKLRSTTNFTKRATAPELEKILYEPLPVLDRGFVRVVDYMGDDDAIVQAARISYGKGTKKISADRGLINYLMRHRHTTPFEMCEIKYHVKLPIFVARQWIRHRTANVNEYSARYSVLKKEFYIPERKHLATQSESNHQGRDDELSEEEASRVLDMLRVDSERSYDHYLEMLNENDEGKILDPNRSGLSRELARMNLSLNFYTEWYWKIDLHNLLHFLSLRADSHSQYEIRAYAETILETVKNWVPFTYDAFMKYYFHGKHVSKQGMDVIRRLIAGESVEQKDSGISPREWRELMADLDIDNVDNQMTA